MNLETLKKHIRTVTEFDWCGHKILLRKLTTGDGLELFKKLRDSGDDRNATIDFHVELAARSLADASGELEANTPEGRELLKQVGFDDLIDLGNIVLRHNGYGDEKKSSAPTSDLPSSSAATLDPPSSTPAS